MSASTRREIPLREHIPEYLPREDLSEQQGEMLFQRYGKQVNVDFPSPKTRGRWCLTAQGWVGQIPLDDEVVLTLTPKVPLTNLFRMWEYAYNLEGLWFPDDLIQSDDLPEFYNRLASILAQRILARGRKGYYRAYLGRTERLPYVRARIDLHPLMRRPYEVQLTCRYQECTADVEENRILVWTLFVIARSGLCRNSTLTNVRRAFHSLQGTVLLEPYGAAACLGRTYNRLNDDYRALHALCRFFLDPSGPTHHTGSRSMIPFLVDMARLYERFVAAWLRLHLPIGLRLDAQQPYDLAPAVGLQFKIDLVLSDAVTREALCVLDTKYKDEPVPSPDDISQVVAYAEAKGCHDAILIYPFGREPMELCVGKIRVRALGFSLYGDLEEVGQRFLDLALPSHDNMARERHSA